MENYITFLGTGTSQGVPMIGCHCEVCSSKDVKDNRLRSSLYVKYNDLRLVIDAGPDFRMQLLRENIDNLDAVLLTHNHKDHTGGLDDVRAFNYFTRNPFPLFAEQYVIDSLKMEYWYAFSEDKYPGSPEFEIHVVENKPFSIKGVEIIPIRAMHHKLPVLGYRIGDMAYVTDSNYIDPSEFYKLEGLSVFIVNCIRKERHLSHYSLSEALEVIRCVGAKQSYLTHISHQLGLYSEIVGELPCNVAPAYDGLSLEIH